MLISRDEGNICDEDLERIVDVLWSNAIADSTVTKSLRSASFEAKGAGSKEGTGHTGTNLRDDQILHVLEASPFASVSPDCSDDTLTENKGVSVPDEIPQLCETEIASISPPPLGGTETNGG
jgi:hypothetical protein